MKRTFDVVFLVIRRRPGQLVSRQPAFGAAFSLEGPRGHSVDCESVEFFDMPESGFVVAMATRRVASKNWWNDLHLEDGKC